MRRRGCDLPPAARRDSPDPSLGARLMAPGSRATIYLCFLGFFFKALICCYRFPRRNEEKRLQMDS